MFKQEFHAAGDNINHGSKFGSKPIEALVDVECIEGLKLMNTWGAEFHNVLNESVCRGHLRRVELLVEAGATLKRPPAMEPCSCDSCDDDTKTRIKALLGNQGVVAAVSIALVFEGALCLQRSGESCSSFYTGGYDDHRFFQAVRAHDLECMKEFHAAGDNINRGLKFGAKPIEALCYDTNLEGLKLMISWGAKFFRALDQSVCRGQPQCVKVLLEAGAVFGRMPHPEPCSCRRYDCDDGIKNIVKDLLTCAVWTRVAKSSGGSQAGECWLREHVPKGKKADGLNSGRNACSILSPGTDFPSEDGHVNQGVVDITKNNEECCKLCNADTRCEAWTRIKSDTEYNREGECWLRSYVPNGVLNDNTDSGRKAPVPK
ncbi:hypothetical protein BSKO_01120 [Bryopsis sp. KO-2023]|nr:hypothetical protein BSKO_01120 [Bryopsis sp. KO-2023]